MYIDNDLPFSICIFAFFFLQRLRGWGVGGKKYLRALFSFKNTLTCFYVYKLKFYTHVSKV